MEISTLKRWHWLAIAVVVGVLIGSAWEFARANTSDPLDQYEKLITDPIEFEGALVDAVNGRRRFDEIVVYPYRTTRGGKAFLVTGQYWDGRSEMRDGQAVARFVSACYVAPSPYRPRLTPERDSATLQVELPTVLDYLNLLRKSSGVRYRYASLAWMSEPMFISIVGGVLVIGLIWPTIINLLTFGSLFRPKEAGGISLWSAASKSSNAPAPPGNPNAEQFDSSPRVEKELDAPREASEGSSDPSIPAVSLQGGPIEPTAAPIDSPPKDFGAGQGDFYPTVLHPKPRAHSDAE